MKVSKFQELEIWKLSTELVIEIYNLTKNSKFSSDFGLRDQIRRAAVSIPSNISEGFEMNNNNDFIRLLKISKGSIGEVKTQLYISLKINYILESEHNELVFKLDILAAQIGGFIKYLLKKKHDKEYKSQ